MARTAVNSSNIAELEYISEGKILEVKFRSGRVYRYRDVPLDLFCRLIEEESPGKLFKAEVQGRFESEEV